MKSIITALNTVCFSILLTGCFTAHQWSSMPVNVTTTEFKTIQEDQLVNFGKVTQNNTDQFAVMGKKNLYLINDENQKINSMLQLHYPNSQLTINLSGDDAIKLEINKDTANQNNAVNDFSVFLRLSLTVQNPSEQLKEELKEKTRKVNSELNVYEEGNKIVLYLNRWTKGKIYSLNEQIKSAEKTNFSKNYPIKIGYDEKKTSFSSGNLAANILITPISLLADAVFTPFAVVGIVGDTILGHAIIVNANVGY